MYSSPARVPGRGQNRRSAGSPWHTALARRPGSRDYGSVTSGHGSPGSVEVRAGAEYFLHPAGSSQRRYEALRSYFTQDMPAAEVADRFGYSTASVHQMATLLRTGRLNLFTDPKPGPKGPRKATGELRARVLALRAAGHSVTEIAAALTAGGLPVSAQTTWQILDAEGIGRLPRRDEGRRGPPARLDVVKAAGLRGWPAGPVSLPCHHAGLLLLFPAMAELGLPRLVRAAGYPSTRQLSSWQSVGSLLLAKCARTARIYHAGSLGDDAGLAFTLGLTALPKATHLGTYSWRARRECNANCSRAWSPRCGRSGWPPARPGSTATSTPSATTAPRRCWKSTTCRAAPSGPARS